MKDLFINRDNLADILERLWSEGEKKGARIMIDPSSSSIQVLNNLDTVIKKIIVVDLVDVYDIAEEVFNQ